MATHDVNSKWHILTESLFRARDLFIPSSLIYADSSPPWFNSEIRHQLNCIHTLRRRLKRNPSSSLSLRLANLESSLTSLISLARSDYEEDLVNTFRFNPKCFYHYLKQKSASPSVPQVVFSVPLTYQPKLNCSTHSSTRCSPTVTSFFLLLTRCQLLLFRYHRFL